MVRTEMDGVDIRVSPPSNTDGIKQLYQSGRTVWGNGMVQPGGFADDNSIWK